MEQRVRTSKISELSSRSRELTMQKEGSPTCCLGTVDRRSKLFNGHAFGIVLNRANSERKKTIAKEPDSEYQMAAASEAMKLRPLLSLRVVKSTSAGNDEANQQNEQKFPEVTSFIPTDLLRTEQTQVGGVTVKQHVGTQTGTCLILESFRLRIK